LVPPALAGADDWRQLIPNLGVHIKLQAATVTKIMEEEIAIRTGLFCKSRLAKTVEEVTSLRSLPKITSFFRPYADNVLELPDEAVPVVHPDDPVIFKEVSSALTRENLAKFIEYTFCRREQSSHFNSLLLHKAILHYVSLNNNNIKQSARLITSLAVTAGSRELDSVLQERWISNIKYYNRTAFKVEGIDLECFVSHFLEKGPA
jgi:hypothetical protein